MKTTEVLGIAISHETPGEVIESLVKTDQPVRVLQINPEIAVALNKSNDQSELIGNVDMFVPNGVGIQWAARYGKKPGFWHLLKTLSWILFRPEKIKRPLSERFTSSSFTLPLLERLSAADKPVHVLVAGSPKGGHIEDTAAHIRKLGRNLKATSFDTANFDHAKQTDLITLAKHEKPDLILLGIGYPKQEETASVLRSKLDHGIIVTEGGTFDYELFGGNIKRAPESWQRLGLEWLWRLAQEPSRLFRQMALLKFIFLVYKSR